jgi:hypothetical protein
MQNFRWADEITGDDVVAPSSAERDDDPARRLSLFRDGRIFLSRSEAEMHTGIEEGFPEKAWRLPSYALRLLRYNMLERLGV